MASLNKVLLIGNLGRDPETRFLPSGGAVCNFSIATTERFKDKQGQQQEKTEWHNIVMYNRLAEIAGEYLKKNLHYRLGLVSHLLTTLNGLPWC